MRVSRDNRIQYDVTKEDLEKALKLDGKITELRVSPSGAHLIIITRI